MEGQEELNQQYLQQESSNSAQQFGSTKQAPYYCHPEDCNEDEPYIDDEA